MSALTILSIATLVTGVAVFYVFALRPVLRAQTFAVRLHFGEGLMPALRGYRVMLVSWLLGTASVLVEFWDWLAPIVAGVDVTPITEKVPGWAWPLIVIAITALFRVLRKITHESEPATAPIVGSATGGAA